MKEHFGKAVAAALAGALAGWVGNALTLVGRVDAIEKSLVRIEQRLDVQVHQPKEKP